MMRNDMPPAPRSLSSGNARAALKLCQRQLKVAGFGNCKDATLWRRTNVKFDVLKFDIIPNTRCEKWRVPRGSFGLAPSCLFPFLPRLGHAPDGEILRPEKGFGQVRLSINRGVLQPLVRVPNVWWVGDSASVFDAVTRDVLSKITGEALPFFSRFDDTEELLRTFLEDDDAIGHEGIWGFWKKSIPQRGPCTPGLRQSNVANGIWAISSLRACKEKTMGIPEPVRDHVRAEILPYVDEGLACAKRERAWPGRFGATVI
jgi:hypothetical protein